MFEKCILKQCSHHLTRFLCLCHSLISTFTNENDKTSKSRCILDRSYVLHHVLYFNCKSIVSIVEVVL